MQPGSDPLGTSSSFTARRSAASNLPTFELPPPPLAALHNKYQPYSNMHSSQNHASSNSVASVGNLLTPPNTLPGDSVPPTSPPTHGASSGQNVQQYQNGGYYSATPQYGYTTHSTSSQWAPPRGLFSPSSLNSIVRNGNSTPGGADGYGMNQLPPFATSMPMPQPLSLPTVSDSQQHAINVGMINNNQSQGSASATQHSPTHGHDQYGGRPPPTPGYYSHHSSSSTQQSSYPYPPNQSSPVDTSRSMNGQRERVTPPSSHADMPALQPATSHSPHQYQRPYGQYPLPGMNGPVMSNIHSPGGQMSLVGNMPNGMLIGYNSGHAANMQHMYGAVQQQQQQPQAQNDRPFKCDQCVQSFSRNHDLKRHKRIHLAVKPYPCGHCDKSFSRKDALKRHILVKGCGKAMRSSDMKADGSMSPISKIESCGSGSPLHASRQVKVEG